MDVSCKVLGWRRITDSFDLMIDTVTLTTCAASSTSTTGRLNSVDERLRKVRDHLAAIAKK
ncbi:hypothetical protein [Rathayibacter sp. AY2B5]|uniref:hypothetical protein n=1 Tax=Rathayibacter sp. AY2B5 TaxID=2080570 RepID=UPI000CE85C68|nr:hypothetical protein [Rathayibacter sp. AY2B5]PPG43956.1 hypothetical protein C5C30_03115 [Rathayibacter sp. AY2B5]